MISFSQFHCCPFYALSMLGTDVIERERTTRQYLAVMPFERKENKNEEISHQLYISASSNIK